MISFCISGYYGANYSLFSLESFKNIFTSSSNVIINSNRIRFVHSKSEVNEMFSRISITSVLYRI